MTTDMAAGGGQAGASLALALDHHQAGRLAEAERFYRAILDATPRHAEALHLSGALALQQGRHLAAVESIGKAIALDRGVARYHNNMGEALRALGRFDEALTSYMRAVALDPGSVEIHYNIGLAFRERGEADIAIACWRRTVGLGPHYGDAYHRLAMAFEEMGNYEEAIGAWRWLLKCSPDFIEAHNRLGNALAALGQRDQAVAHYRRILELGDFAWAHHNLAFALCEGGDIHSAMTSWKRALELAPEFAEAHNGIGNAYIESGDFRNAIASYRKAAEFRPNFLEALSNILVTMPMIAELAPEDVFAEARRIGARFEAAVAERRLVPHANDPTPDRRLRIGYLTPSLTAHVLAPYMEPVLGSHRRENVEVHVYAQVPRPDAVTQRLKALADHWTFVHDMTDEEVERRIRNDRIDILIDPMGHWAGNRLPVFARKPAPIQVSYLCQGSTTGLETMDYLIADRWLNEGGAVQALSVENVVELAGGFQTTLYDEEVPIGPPPSEAAGFITFGSCNNPNKISTATLELWAGVLKRVASSRLLIKGRFLQRPERSALLRQRLEAFGIAPERVEIFGTLPDAHHMAFYNRIDISLDTTPFTGGRTTLDSVWMGVPVVSLIGPTAYSRFSYSHLSRIGHPDLVARNTKDYVDIAAGLAADAGRLHALRATLRPEMKASSLFDAATHTGELEAAFRIMWRRWCDGQPPAPFSVSESV